MKVSLFHIFCSFFKVGVVGFGGGSALIPIVEREIVGQSGYITKDDYVQHTVIANITPGTLPVKLGATCGYVLNGWGGSLVGAFSVMLPGVLCTVFIMAFLSLLGENAIQYFEYASVGITAFIVFLLASYIRKTVLAGNMKINLLICATAFIVTGGKELRQIIAGLTGTETGTALLDITTIDLMLLSFFLIFLISFTRRKGFLGAGGLLAVFYCFVSGKWAAAHLPSFFSTVTVVVMGGYLLVVVLTNHSRAAGGTVLSIPSSTFMTVLAFLVVIAVGFAVSIVAVGPQISRFLADVGISTVTSFGGGEAYVSVADGMFVQEGLIASDMYYSRLVPVANALPGPILVKIAAGIAYLHSGGVPGFVLAFGAACVSTSVCSLIAVFLFAIYDSVKESKVILGLKTYILPVICGMLISTSLSMFVESMHVMDSKAIPVVRDKIILTLYAYVK